MHRFALLFLFSFSAAAGLIYQISWVRQTTLIFGVSVYAYSAVLAAFMAGTALGSFALRHRVTPPLRVYALLQLGIAFFGAISPFALTALLPLYGSIAQSLPTDSPWLTPVRVLLAILVLVPPTFLMGGTFPAMAHAFAQRNGRVGSDLSRLYSVDLLGAALGCAITGLWLLRLLGTQNTIFLAVAINLFCALIAWFFPMRNAELAGAPARNSKHSASSQDKLRTPNSALLWFALMTGFAAIGYEIVWARILSVFTLDAVYSFAITLTTFLIGLAIGSWLGAHWVKRQVRMSHYGVVELASGIAALMTLLIFFGMPSVALEDVFGTYSVGNAIAFEFLLGFLALLLPTILLGLRFPLLVSLYTHEQVNGASSRIGLLSALNTAGAILGSLLVGFGLIPWLGLKGSLLALAAINMAIGLAACWIGRSASKQWWLVPVIGSGLALLIALIAPAGYYLGFRADPGEHMVYYGEGVETTVAVFDVADQNFKISFVNGRSEVPTDAVSMKAFRLLGHLAPILRPDAQSALMLSFGNGIASGSLDTHGIPHIDAVDLSAEQFEAAKIYFVENHNILHSPRLHTHVEDGRNFLLQTTRQYDIITTDATHPSNASSWALFTQEFYESVASRLNSDGIFVQWLPFHSLLESDYRAILRTFQHVFPHTTLWYSGGTHTTLVATADELTPEQLARKLQAISDNTIVLDELGPPTQIASYWAMNEHDLRNYAGEGTFVVDDRAFFLPDNTDTPKIMAIMEKVVQERSNK